MTHADYLDLLAGEALDDLDASERDTLRAHAVGCPKCAAEAASLDEVLVDLALAAPPRRPSPGLEARIMAAVAATPRSEAAARVTAGAASPAAILPASTPKAPRMSWLGWFGRPRLALAAVGIAIVLAASSLILGLRASNLERTVATQDAALAVLADPAHLLAPLIPEGGTTSIVAMAVYVPHSDRAYVMAIGLPATPSDRVYQLWYADTAGVHPLGTYRYDGSGTFVAPFGVDLAGSAAAMVTLEPVGGAVGEPGPQVVFGELPAGES